MSTTPISGPPPRNDMQSSHQTSEPNCLLCMNLNKDPVYQSRCGRDHYYCQSCIKHFLDRTGICPQCQKEGRCQGNQPSGHMTWNTVTQSSLPGYEDCGIIIMDFKFHKGVQGTSKFVRVGNIWFHEGTFSSVYLSHKMAPFSTDVMDPHGSKKTKKMNTVHCSLQKLKGNSLKNASAFLFLPQSRLSGLFPVVTSSHE